MDWIDYYSVLLAKLGVDKLRRVKSRLYEKLETVKGEIDEIEEVQELCFLPEHPEFVPFIEQQIEALVTLSQQVSIELETVIGLLEEARYG